MDKRSKNRVRVRVGERIITATGKEADTLLLLIERGNEGASPLDAHRAGPAFRLAAYVFDLKKLGVPIECKSEKHAGGRHGRYFLTSHVVIIDRNDLAQVAA